MQHQTVNVKSELPEAYLGPCLITLWRFSQKYLLALYISIPPENVRKPLVF